MTSRVLTPRVLALAAATALAGTPLLMGSPASAAQSTGTVTFNGGCGLLGSGLGGTSTPDATQLSVPAGSGVRFANRLGQPAILTLNGESVGQVPAGGAADVVFRKGPVTASMYVSCMLGSPAGTVTVEVIRADPAPVRPPAAPSAPAATERPPARQPASGDAPRAAAAKPSPPSATVEGVWWPDATSQPPAALPADAGEQDGGDRAGRNGNPRGRWARETEPADGGDQSAEPVTVDEEPADGELAAQPMERTAGSATEDGPVGLLALIATVCVVGVSAGAIRTLITQRANRAEWA